MNPALIEYSDYNIDGHRIVMTERNSSSGTTFLIGNRFFYFVRTRNPEMAFEFFRHYCPLFSLKEIKKAWQAYQKAKLQKCDRVANAFWNYFDGKTIKMISRKGACFQWVELPPEPHD